MREGYPERSAGTVWVVVSAILGASFVLGVAIVATTFYRVRVRPDTLAATGSARQRITSDAAKWMVSFSRRTANKDVREANAAMERDLRLLLAYLHQNGVTDDEMTLSPVRMDPEYEPVKVGQDYQQRLSEYRLHQMVHVESGDVAKVARLAVGVSSLMNEGMLVSSFDVQYYYTKLPELRVVLLESAVEDARRRAAAIAEKGGSRIGKLKAVSTGAIQVLQPHSTEVSAEGRYDTSTLEKEAMATVRATFVLR